MGGINGTSKTTNTSNMHADKWTSKTLRLMSCVALALGCVAARGLLGSRRELPSQHDCPLSQRYLPTPGGGGLVPLVCVGMCVWVCVYVVFVYVVEF